MNGVAPIGARPVTIQQHHGRAERLHQVVGVFKRHCEMRFEGVLRCQSAPLLRVQQQRNDRDPGGTRSLCRWPSSPGPAGDFGEKLADRFPDTQPRLRVRPQGLGSPATLIIAGPKPACA